MSQTNNYQDDYDEKLLRAVQLMSLETSDFEEENDLFIALNNSRLLANDSIVNDNGSTSDQDDSDLDTFVDQEIFDAIVNQNRLDESIEQFRQNADNNNDNHNDVDDGSSDDDDNDTSDTDDDDDDADDDGNKNDDDDNLDNLFDQSTIDEVYQLIDEIYHHEQPQVASSSPSSSSSSIQLPVQQQNITEITCALCLDEKQLADFREFGQCQHLFCRVCLGQFLAQKISDGIVLNIKCPSGVGDSLDSQCSVEASHQLIRELLDPDLLVRYDELLLKKNVEHLDNVINCPTCNLPVEFDSGTCLAYCYTCDYAFCTSCGQVYHGATDCVNNDDEESRRQREAENHESELFINANFKQCPQCSSPCDKDEGCNHVICKNCHVQFCWLCLTDVSDKQVYDRHYLSECVLFAYDFIY
ncbi:E3 ubiquitin-protein ligase RNF14-like [Oppia nitens]|uniref:E3 ubiquitin-protein ligase RNF14-like n=1 Tax=Oppia nitens TaxID=1686743 RepID=UPI0023DBEFC8|nr:E3 ubiquitin-protein ligase RNF14-like [Oppia nitens]